MCLLDPQTTPICCKDSFGRLSQETIAVDAKIKFGPITSISVSYFLR